METEATCWDESFDGEQRGPECMAAVRSSEVRFLFRTVWLACLNGEGLVLSLKRSRVCALYDLIVGIFVKQPRRNIGCWTGTVLFRNL